MRSLVPLVLMLSLLAGASAPAAGDVLRFAVDPARSTITAATGTQLVLITVPGIFFSPNQFPGFGNVAIAAQPPSSGSGGTLPGGAQSDGLSTSLEGYFEAALDVANPSTIEFLAGLSRIELGNSGSWLPGLPLAPGAPAPGDLAFEFDDATIDWGASVVMRDAVGGVSSSGPVPLVAGAPGTHTFAAGCTAGVCPSFGLGEILLDIDAERIAVGRRPVRLPAPLVGAPATGQLQSLGGGRFQVTLPFDVTVHLDGGDVQNPLPSTVDLHLTGQIVAVPEPAPGLSLLAAFAALAAVWSMERRPHPRRLVAILAIFALLGLACRPNNLIGANDHDESEVGVATNPAPTQTVRVEKEDPPGSEVFQGSPTSFGPKYFTGSFGIPFTNFLFTQDAFFQDFGLNGNMRCGAAVDLQGTPSTAMWILQHCVLSLFFPPALLPGSTSYLFARALTTQYGAAVDEQPGTGTCTVTGPGGATDVPVNQRANTQIDLGSAGGTAEVSCDFEARRVQPGAGDQTLLFQWAWGSSECSNNLECEMANPSLPFCSAGVCTDGVDVDCDDSVECDDGADQVCWEGSCQDRQDITVE